MARTAADSKQLAALGMNSQRVRRQIEPRHRQGACHRLKKWRAETKARATVQRRSPNSRHAPGTRSEPTEQRLFHLSVDETFGRKKS